MAIYISVTNQQLSAESDFIKYEIAGTFTLLACLISMWHVWGHLRHFGRPFFDYQPDLLQRNRRFNVVLSQSWRWSRFIRLQAGCL